MDMCKIEIKTGGESLFFDFCKVFTKNFAIWQKIFVKSIEIT